MPEKSSEEELEEEVLGEFDQQQANRNWLAILQQGAHVSKADNANVPANRLTKTELCDSTQAKVPVVNLSTFLSASSRELAPKPITVLAGFERRNLRDRTGIHAGPKFADEYAEIGSKKSN